MLANVRKGGTTRFDAGGSERIEFKEAVNDKTIAAFANSGGGKVCIGVSDDGEVIGVQDVDGELLKLTNKMKTNIRPDILMTVSVDIESYGDEKVIVVTVGRGTKRPYYLTSKGLRSESVYVRSGAASVPSSETAILQMIQESSSDSFEPHLSMKQDLSFEFAVSYFAESGLNLVEVEMRTLGMLGTEGFTNLALLLSDQCPAFVKAASFDDDSRDVFLERAEFSGSILKQLEDAYGFLLSHNKFKTEYDGLRRVDYDNYPKQALREAIANAVAHREYALSGPTLVSVMPSSVEITSLGGLVPGITQEDLEANISMPRNKLLAALMYRLGVIEAWGTGIGRMRSSYGDVGAEVEISITPNTFSVKLPNRNAVGSTRKQGSDEHAVIRAVKDGCDTRAKIQQQTGFSQSKTIGLLRKLVNAGALEKEGGIEEYALRACQILIKMVLMKQSLRTLREAWTKEGRWTTSGPLILWGGGPGS